MPEEVLILFESLLKEEWGKSKDINTLSQEDKLKRIKHIEKEMEAIVDKIEKLNTDALIQKFEERYAVLSTQKDDIEFSIANLNYEQNEFENVLRNARTILKDPLAIREMNNVEIKQLLLRVCFKNKIYYKKNQGLHTPDISLLYAPFEDFQSSNSRMVDPKGVEPLTSCVQGRRSSQLS